MTLKKLVIQASYWTFMGHAGINIIRLGSNLVLTRILFPELFGLMAVVFVVLSVVGMLTDTGIRPFIIQNKDHCSEEIINTVWTFQIIRGLVIWLLVGLVSIGLHYLQINQLISSESTFSDNRLPILIFWVSFSSVISGFNSISIFLLDRQLMVKLMQIVYFVSRLISTIFMIIYAYFWPNVWALVFGSIIYTILVMVASHLFIPQKRHKLHLDKKIAIRILTFGKWIMVSTMMSMFIMHGDKLILGGFINPAQLGIYATAILFIDALRSLFHSLSRQVWFPLLSEVNRQETLNVSDVYYRIRFFQDLASYTVAGILFVLAPLLIEILYDNRYIEAGHILKILSLSLAGISIETMCFVLLSVGDTKAASSVRITQAIVLWVLLYISIKYVDFDAALWVISLNFIISLPVVFYQLNKHKILIWYKEIWTLPFLGVGYFIGISIASLYSML